jgi:peptidoglycan/LPS O-acetylase OafA/YrhL
LKRYEHGRISKWINILFNNPLGLLLIAAAFLIEAILVKPEIYETYAMTWHGFFLGMLAFLFGFLGVFSGNAFWNTVLKWRWVLLILAVALFLVRYLVFDLTAPYYLLVPESCSWIFSLFGLGYRYLNHPSKTLRYLSQAAYPVYIIHMIFLYLASCFIMPLNIPIYVQLVLVTLLTGIGCFAFYDLIIRRIGFIKPLFGLKTGMKNKQMSIEQKGRSLGENEKLLDKAG